MINLMAEISKKFKILFCEIVDIVNIELFI